LKLKRFAIEEALGPASSLDNRRRIKQIIANNVSVFDITYWENIRYGRQVGTAKEG